MNRLQKLYDVTMELMEVLDQEITSKNRESIIEQVNLLVDKRGKYMDGIVPPYSEDEKQLGQKLVQINDEIKKLMQQLFNELKLQMKQVKKQKKSNRTYINPYEKVQSMDGMFLDSKK